MTAAWGCPPPISPPTENRERLLAHVDVLNDGSVWMDPALSTEDQDWLAAAAAPALLMKVD